METKQYVCKICNKITTTSNSAIFDLKICGSCRITELQKGGKQK